jgi:hypothetical protein
MITLIMLLSFTTAVAMALIYGVIRVSLWKNRALFVIIISALYFIFVFMAFSHYGGLLG